MNCKTQYRFNLELPAEWNIPRVTARIFKTTDLYEDKVRSLWAGAGDIGLAVTLVPDDKSYIEVLFSAETISIEFIMHELSHVADELSENVKAPDHFASISGWDNGEWKAVIIGFLADEFIFNFRKYFDLSQP